MSNENVNVFVQARNDPFAALTREKWEEIVRDCQRTGKDVHRATAAFMFNAPYEEVTLEQRAIAKRYTFAFRFSVE